MKLNWFFAKNILLILAVLVMSGCAHKINVSPDVSEITGDGSGTTIEKNVAYYISPEDRAKQVKTNGGGGDKVKYFPYAETELALHATLASVFNKVYSIESLENKQYIEDNKIQYVFVPEIVTSSSAKSILTWPPKEFIVRLTCKALDQQGSVVWSQRMESVGDATYKEIVGARDYGIAGKRAFAKTFQRLHQELTKEALFRQ